jgi:hypothetical protein
MEQVVNVVGYGVVGFCALMATFWLTIGRRLARRG